MKKLFLIALFFLTTNQLHSDSGEHGKAELAELFLEMEQTAIYETFGAVGAGFAANQQKAILGKLDASILGMCEFAAGEFQDIFPIPHNKLLNRDDLSHLVFCGIIAPTALHYRGSITDLQGSIAQEVFSQYVGSKTVDLTVWGINGFTNWWADRDMINPDSKKVECLKFVTKKAVLMMFAVKR